MPLERHHKVMIGGFSTLIIIFIIVSSILTYTLFARVEYNQKQLEKKINQLQADTQNKLNDLTTNILKTREDLNSLNTEFGTLGTQIGSIDTEISKLKASTSSDFSGIVENAIKSVVTIRTDVGQGTGFIITNDGYLVTNAHVLEGGRRVYAITYEQETVNAGLIGYDLDEDIALLKISGDYKSLILGNSNDVQIGEKVIAIGNPLGLQFSVTEGIVSAIHRPGPNEEEAYIQTDASLNPGNSGGPLIDKEGKVIGINNYKVGDTEGLGFALESNYIEYAVNAISKEKLNQTLI